MDNKKSGFSLIETAIVLGIVGLVIGGIWVAAAAVFTNQKYKDLLDGTTFIVDQTQSLLPSSAYDRGPLSGVYLYIQSGMRDTGIKMGLFPAHWVSGTAVKSPFGGVVYLFAVDSNKFQIQFFSSPRDICIKLVGAIASHPGQAGGSVSPSGIMWDRSLTGYSIPFRQSGCTNSTNTVTLYFDFVLH